MLTFRFNLINIISDHFFYHELTKTNAIFFFSPFGQFRFPHLPKDITQAAIVKAITRGRQNRADRDLRGGQDEKEKETDQRGYVLLSLTEVFISLWSCEHDKK